jgi:asparagine synthase (glutamine-hydrolysing)
MCGICGIATRGETPDADVITRMCDTIVHRGPDGEGRHVAAGIGLGMRRLSIIDLATGWQPMTNEAGTAHVVFNGEIYNYRELRAELEAKGHRFRTQSDTEVIAPLYDEHGVDFARRLNGIFAIALWDDRLRRLLLVRDRVGIKPLYWSQRDGRLFFGSEVKCILAADGSARTLDVRGLDQLLSFEYTASPTTLFADVQKLAPGGWLTWQAGDVATGRFWEMPTGPAERGASVDEWAERVRATVDAAVARQMVSDVPLGAFLSGGIDSSIIVSAMSRASERKVKTFSVGFRDASYDELPFARIIAGHCATDHHEEVLEPRYLSLVEDVVRSMDQPIADFSVFPTLLVSRMARSHVTVALAGDGGDELFAGYDEYVADRMVHRTLDRLPGPVRRAAAWLGDSLAGTEAKKDFRNSLKRLLEGAALPATWQHMRWRTFLAPAAKRALYTSDFQRQAEGACERLVLAFLDNGGEDRLQQQLFCDTRFYLPENILAKVDLMSMATSLEARVPFLDNEVIDLALRMPSELKWPGRRPQDRKLVLKRAYADALPPAILGRGKQGFSIPLKTWLKNDWRPLMHDLLAEPALREDGVFEPATVARWMTEHESGRANHSHVLWALMVFQLWKRAFLRPPVA